MYESPERLYIDKEARLAISGDFPVRQKEGRQRVRILKFQYTFLTRVLGVILGLGLKVLKLMTAKDSGWSGSCVLGFKVHC